MITIMSWWLVILTTAMLACGGQAPDRPTFLDQPVKTPATNTETIATTPTVTDSSPPPNSPGTDPSTMDTNLPIPTAIPSIPAIPEVVPAKPIAKVVINEIFYDAVGSDTNGVLFVELFGPVGADLSGYQLVFVNGDDGKIYDTLTLPVEAKIDSKGFYLIADAKTGSFNESFVIGADWAVNFDPQNGPDAVQLLNSEGEFRDALGYGALTFTTTTNTYPIFEGNTAPDVVNGHSLERKTPGLDTDNNLVDFVDRDMPTPGR